MKHLENKGFTLVEVIVAFVILAVAGGAVLNSFAMAVKLNAKAEREFQAANGARAAMEYMLHLEDLKTAVVTWAGSEENYDRLEPEGTISLPEVAQAVNFGGASEDAQAIFSEWTPAVTSIVLCGYQSGDGENPPTVVCEIEIQVTGGTGEVAELTGRRRIELTPLSGGSGT